MATQAMKFISPAIKVRVFLPNLFEILIKTRKPKNIDMKKQEPINEIFSLDSQYRSNSEMKLGIEYALAKSTLLAVGEAVQYWAPEHVFQSL
jgi:hypothetical protein